MDRPRIVSVVAKDAEERTPPDEAGVNVLESYVPAEPGSASQAARAKPQQAPPQAKPASGALGSLFSKIRSLFGR